MKQATFSVGNNKTVTLMFIFVVLISNSDFFGSKIQLTFHYSHQDKHDYYWSPWTQGFAPNLSLFPILWVTLVVTNRLCPRFLSNHFMLELSSLTADRSGVLSDSSSRKEDIMQLLSQAEQCFPCFDEKKWWSCPLIDNKVKLIWQKKCDDLLLLCASLFCRWSIFWFRTSGLKK